MGVTPRRIGFAALLLASVLLPLREPKSVASAESVDDRSNRLYALINQERAANYMSSALDVREIALRAIPTDLPVNQPPPLMMFGFPHAVTDSESEARTARLWKKIGPTDAAVRTAIVAYNDERFPKSTYTGTLFTQRDGLSWCVAIVPAAATPAGGARVRQYSFDEAIAPCTFFAAFGLPGEGVRAWLTARQYALLQSDHWLTRPKDYTDRAGPWMSLYEPFLGPFREPPLLMRALGSLNFTSLLVPPYQYGATGLRCMRGDQAACARAVQYAPTRDSAYRQFPADLTVPYWMARREQVTLITPRLPDPSLVSAMVSDHDRARFSRFWKSDRPVEAAFQDAFGESLGAWTARWAAREWQSSFWMKFRQADFLLGVTLHPSWPFLVIAWSGVALLIAAQVARRRTA